MPVPALDPPQAAMAKAMANPRAVYASLRLVFDAFIKSSLGGRWTTRGQKHSKPTRPKLQDPVSTFQLAGASCFSDMHYVTALKLARRSDTSLALELPRAEALAILLPPAGCSRVATVLCRTVQARMRLSSRSGSATSRKS